MLFRSIELITSDRPFTIHCYAKSSIKIPGHDFVEYEVLRMGSRWCYATNAYVLDGFSSFNVRHGDERMGDIHKEIAKLRNDKFADTLFYPLAYDKVEFDGEDINTIIYYVDVVGADEKSIFLKK